VNLIQLDLVVLLQTLMRTGRSVLKGHRNLIIINNNNNNTTGRKGRQSLYNYNCNLIILPIITIYYSTRA